LTFDFSGTESNKYNKLALFFDFGKTTGNTFYFDDIIQSNDVTTEIHKHTKTEFSVYPNPAKEALYVVASTPLSHQHNESLSGTEVTINNTLGQTVFNSILIPHNSSLNIDISHLPQGLYFIRMNNYTQKIIKK